MIHKALKASEGVKVKTVFNEEKAKAHRETREPQERVDNCLGCGKPADKCKGTCYGRNK